MAKFDQYLIVSDLDGTFFGPKCTILENNIEAIQYFVKNGGKFTVATGRDLLAMLKIFPNVETILSCPAILCNGAYFYDFQTKTISHEVSLNKPEFLSVLQMVVNKFPGTGFRISSDIGFLCPNMSKFLAERMVEFMDITKTDSLDHYMDHSWHKCVFVAEPEIITDIGKFLDTLALTDLSVTTSHSTLAEIIPKESGKGKKIKQYENMFPDRKIICVGDNGNDLDMLRVADLAACPENAIDLVKTTSSIHLCHHRDGCIADLIYKLDSSIKE
jgi:Cof subfamily protein (haloacid dehalogenase superfamily)